MKAHVIIGFVCCLMVAGCAAKYSPQVRSQKAIRVSDPILTMKAVRLSDSTVRLSFVGPPALRSKGRAIRYVEVAVGPTKETMVDTLPFHTMVVGSPEANTIQNIIGDVTWDTKAAILSTSCWVDVGVVTAEEHLIFLQHLEYEDALPMELTPFTNAVSDTIVEVGAMARRIYVPPGEYLPSSENFRVVISDGKGRVVYRSDYGASFLTLITTVEPQTPNQVQRYAIPWNGRDLEGSAVPDGTYRADVIIPANPKPYVAFIEVPWPPK
ncbi:MAG: hypothetical protein HYX66_01540 [Ignavibacteria bacterium]|nr:hypothetical protein [Ignavibacteria bacterium]